MNNTVGSSFKIDFAEIRTCESREQYTGSTQKKRKCAERYPNPALVCVLHWF